MKSNNVWQKRQPNAEQVFVPANTSKRQGISAITNIGTGQHSNQTTIAGNVGTSGGDFIGRDRVNIHVNIFAMLHPAFLLPCPMSSHLSLQCSFCCVTNPYTKAEYKQLLQAIHHLLKAG